jgi:hypothetical protein
VDERGAVSKFPAASRSDHDSFCVKESWILVHGASGQPVTHHRTYELPLDDGRILRTRISKPVHKDTYAASTWAHILRNQLDVTAEEFWTCVKNDQLPVRGKRALPQSSLPLYLVKILADEIGMSPQAISELDLPQAERAVAAHWSKKKN